MSEHAVAERLRRQITTEIATGQYSPGVRLGSERELALRYGVSRATLRQVLAALDEAGLVSRVAGRSGGTFVKRQAKVDHDPTGVLMGVPAYLARQGYDAGTRVISASIELADESVCKALRLNSDDLVIQVRRLRLADSRPISLDNANFPAERFPGLLEMPLGGSLAELMSERFGAKAVDAEELIEVVYATDEEAALLAVEVGAALLSITRTAYDSDGEPFEYSTDLVRADRTRISLHTPGRSLRDSLQPRQPR